MTITNPCLEEFKKDTYDAIQRGISPNPILHSFQMTVNRYDIDLKLVDLFQYGNGSFEKYITRLNMENIFTVPRKW
jgi:hypothetical protein